MNARTHRTGWPPALVVLALVAALAGCDVSVPAGGGFGLAAWTGKAEDTWVRTYPIAAAGRLDIINTNGPIIAEGSEGTTIDVRAVRSVAAASDDEARTLLHDVEMREEVSAERVRIETRAPRGRRGHYQVEFRIRVPKGVHVDVRTVNGGIRLDNVDGEVRATATNGGVRGRIAGTSVVDARTTNGGVELALTGRLAVDGRVTLSSVNGGVRLQVPHDTQAQVRARCTNGRISVDDLPFLAEGDQERRRLSGTINGGGARIDLQTTNGGVTIGRS